MATKTLTRTARAIRWMRSPAGQKLSHTAPALVVFGVAAYQSYWHTVEVVVRSGEGDHGVAHIMALSVDGLMMVAARYITHAPTVLGKVIAFVAFIGGILATVASNVMAADPNGFSRSVAVWPAIALVGTAAMLHWGERKAPRTAAKRRSPAVGTPAPVKRLRSVQTG